MFVSSGLWVHGTPSAEILLREVGLGALLSRVVEKSSAMNHNAHHLSEVFHAAATPSLWLQNRADEAQEALPLLWLFLAPGIRGAAATPVEMGMGKAGVVPTTRAQLPGGKSGGQEVS